MKVRLEKYSDREDYSKGIKYDSAELVGSTTEALKKARKAIAKVRKGKVFLGFSINTLGGETMHKLPSY